MKTELSSSGKRLIFWGICLFLAGILQGLAIPYFTIPRMGLSAHLAAVQGGMVLIVFGVIWRFIILGDKYLNITCYASIAGMYLVWFAITLSAILGAGESLPIAAAGFSSTPFNELIVEAILTLGALLLIVSTVFIVRGLSKKSQECSE